MAEGDRGTARYAAFLSYSHKDEAVARWLHRKLESYRIPRRLVGTEGERGVVPARLSPIFRDRDELAAAGDLSEKVRAALAISDNLIVVCSPNSAGSQWVTKEIAVYRNLNPSRPIFAAIVEGEPDECFPEGLVQGESEPLAADLRRSQDGRRLGLLKLAAGIVGVRLDSLIQRDAARRIRRVTYLSVAALVASALMAVLTLVAFNARAEAERQRVEAEKQRADAEGLVEFMRTDLRDVLRTVGRLDILSLVNERALRRYAGQNLTGLPDDALERRAQILHLMGEDDMIRGEFAAALAAFREAHRTTGSLLRKSPNDPARIFGHGQSDYWIGHIYELQDDWPQAARRYELYAKAAERLTRINPRNPDYMLEMAWGESNRGVVQRDGLGDQAAAQRRFERAIRWFEQAIRSRPRKGDLRDLANAYGNLADTYHERGLWKQALEMRLNAHRIIEPLHRLDPKDFELTFRLAIAERAIAHESARNGDRRAALPFMLQAYKRMGGLTKRDPRNAEWSLFRSMIECDLLNPKLGLKGPSKVLLRRNLRRSAAALTTQQNPRITEIQQCLER